MQTVVIRLLPDGSGRVCIHWLYEHPEGPIESLDNYVQTAAGPRQIAKGKRWRMACSPGLSHTTETDGARILPHCHTDDPRAATCPRCLASTEYKAVMAYLESVLKQGA